VLAQIANFEEDARQDEEELTDELKQKAQRLQAIDQSDPEKMFKVLSFCLHFFFPKRSCIIFFTGGA
jgi:hypothetical protein